MTATTTLRVGIAGCAHASMRSYARALGGLAGATLAGIWDADTARGQAVALEHGAALYDRLDELLARVDALVVAAETARHADLALAAAAAGVHVLCEPPLATTIADGQAIVEACAAAGVRLGMAFPARYSDAARQLRAAVQGGALGETLLIRATNRGVYPGGWLADPALAGGGAIMDRTQHVADMLRWIWQREFAEVYAETATRHHELPVEDSALLLITLEGGLSASLDASWSRPGDAWPAEGDLALEVTGATGAASLDMLAQNVELYSSARGRAQRLGWGDNLSQLMIADWLRALGAGEPAPIGGEEGLRALELALAAYRSAQSHLPERVR